MEAAALCNHLQQADPSLWKAVVAESMSEARGRAVHVDDMVMQALADGGALSVEQVGYQGLAMRLDVPSLHVAATCAAVRPEKPVALLCTCHCRLMCQPDWPMLLYL